MNTDQIIRLAMYQAEAVKVSGSTAAALTTYEVNAWANDANYRLEQALRVVNENYFVRTINSATASQSIFGRTYAGTSLTTVSGTLTYNLPPDFARLVSVRFTGAGYLDNKIERRYYFDPEFQEALRTSATYKLKSGASFYYDVIGERTLAIVPDPLAAITVEICYVSRWHKLRSYSTGTLAVTDATTAVTGTNTVWSTGTPLDAAYLDIMFGTSASATVPTAHPNLDYDGVNLGAVSSITNDTALVLAANRVGTLAAGTGYVLSTVPRIPVEYHGAIADYATARALAKFNSASYKYWLDLFTERLNSIAPDATRAITDTGRVPYGQFNSVTTDGRPQ